MFLFKKKKKLVIFLLLLSVYQPSHTSYFPNGVRLNCITNRDFKEFSFNLRDFIVESLRTGNTPDFLFKKKTYQNIRLNRLNEHIILPVSMFR